jgi:carbonic anhydrase/acetyltransferase-like protein (isoleucine patch superfamily)
MPLAYGNARVISGDFMRLPDTPPVQNEKAKFVFAKPAFAPRNGDGMSDLVKQLDMFLRKQPRLGRGVYIASRAVVLGDVTLGDQSSVWHNAVLRGDINRIAVGHHSNVQDNAVLHLADDFPCVVGNYVTIGHSAIVHACTIGDECLIGMGATILDGANIGEQSIVGANALVTQHTQVPAGSLVLGSPAKIVRSLTAEERQSLRSWAEKYVVNAAYCLQHAINVGSPLAS